MTAEEIQRASLEARYILQKIRELPAKDLRPEDIHKPLHQAVCRKLGLMAEEEENIRRLVILSIKQRDKQSAYLPDSVVQKQIRSYDCHQTSLVVQKKVLLIMFIERELGVSLDDGQAADVETVGELAWALAERLREAGG